MEKKKSVRRNRIIDAIWSNALIILLALIWLVPIVWVILASFSTQTGYKSSTFFPTSYTVDNYVKLFTKNLIYKKSQETSLALQWLRLHLPMQGMWFNPLGS